MTFAYLTLVMKGDAYVSGALVLGKSLRETGTQHVIACMITNDVSLNAREDLARIFDAVHVVDYYEARVAPLRTDKAESMYQAWMSISLTWYRCLALKQYKKVYLLDSDVTILRNMDNVFNMRAPAGCFHSFWRPLYYGKLTCGQTMNKFKIKRALDDTRGGYVCIGNGLLLAPHEGAWMAFDTCMKEFAKRHNGVLGFPKCYSGINEQMIAYFYWKHDIPWTHVGTQYQIIPWKRVDDPEEPPYLFHYFNIKPWMMDLSAFPDLQVWWRFAKAVVDENPRCIEYIPEEQHSNLKEIDSFMVNTCLWCKNRNHAFITPECEIACPNFWANKPVTVA